MRIRAGEHGLRILIGLLVVTIASASEAGDLKGLVLENEVNGRPLPKVRVDAIGANQTETEFGGKFMLRFPKLGPGDSVRVIANKQGYVVVNDVQLDTVILANPHTKPLLILMCERQSREEMARRYYRLRALDAIDDSYRKHLQSLEREKVALGAEFRKHSKVLEAERDLARATAEKMAQDFATEKTSGRSELHREAMRLFLDGNVEEALRVLDKDELQRHREVARQRKKQSAEDLEENARAWILKGRMLTLRFRLEDATQAYREAIETAPDSFEANFQFGMFNQDLNRFEEARKAYDRSLEIARRAQNDGEIANSLNNIGILHRDQNHMEEARQAFDEALQIDRRLAKQNPGVYLPCTAAMLNNLGLLSRDQKHMEEARKAFDEALQIRRKLARQNPEINLPHVAVTLNNLGVLLIEQERKEDARKAFSEALQIYRQLAQQNPKSYLPDVARTLNNLGDLSSRQNQMEAASKAFDEALQIRRGLAQQNPETYMPDVAAILNNIGILRGRQNQMEAASKAFDEALQIRRSLAQQNPETYLPDVAKTLNNLGILYHRPNQRVAARKALEASLDIYRSLAEKDPARYGSDVTRIEYLLQAVVAGGARDK